MASPRPAHTRLQGAPVAPLARPSLRNPILAFWRLLRWAISRAGILHPRKVLGHIFRRWKRIRRWPTPEQFAATSDRRKREFIHDIGFEARIAKAIRNSPYSARSADPDQRVPSVGRGSEPEREGLASVR